MSEFTNILRLQVDDILENIVNEAKNNLQRQGHRLSGALIDSVQKKVTVQGDSIKGIIEFLAYGVQQDTGIKPENIPYKGNTGRGGKSEYISGLQRFALKRGMAANDKEALSIAFAIAKTHAKEGMHTKGGRRAPEQQGWFSGAVEKYQQSIDAAIEAAIGEALNVIIEQAVNEANRNTAE